jgi:hypothetical protein
MIMSFRKRITSKRAIKAAYDALLHVIDNLEEKKKRHRRRLLWTREWIRRRERMGSIVCYYESCTRRIQNRTETCCACLLTNYRSYFRWFKIPFRRQPLILRSAAPARVKLEVALQWMTSGDSFVSLSYLFHLPVSTISTFTPYVLEGIEGSPQF